MGKIFVVLKRPGQAPESVYIENELEEFQKLVGGYIETLTLATNLAIIFNEEGRLLGLPHNFNLCGLDLVGNVVFVRVKGDEFASAPSIDYLCRLFPALRR